MSEPGKYAPVPGQIPGRAVNLGGVVFVMAPLNLDGVRAYPAAMAEVASASADPDQIAAFFAASAELLLLSLVRNYPDLTAVELVPLLDMGNVAEAAEALRAVSGFARSGEAAPASRSTP